MEKIIYFAIKFFRSECQRVYGKCTKTEVLYVMVHVGCFRRVRVDGVERTGMWEPRGIEYETG